MPFNNLTGTDTPYSPLSHTALPPQAAVCIACFFVKQATHGPLPLSGQPRAANRCWVCPMPAASPAWVDAENDPWD